MAGAIVLAERGEHLTFTHEDLRLYHGPGSPAGVAHAFKVLERGLPILAREGPCERRAVTVRTAFGGPGARDAFEMATRAVSDGRFTLDHSLARTERGRTLERFVFVLGHRGREATLVVREGFVPDELIDLARIEPRTTAQERRFAECKREAAALVLDAPAEAVYDVDGD